MARKSKYLVWIGSKLDSMIKLNAIRPIMLFISF